MLQIQWKSSSLSSFFEREIFFIYSLTGSFFKLSESMIASVGLWFGILKVLYVYPLKVKIFGWVEVGHGGNSNFKKINLQCETVKAC